VRYEVLLGVVGALIVAEAVGATMPPPQASQERLRWLRPAAAILVALAVTLRAATPLRDTPQSDAIAALDKVPPSVRAQPVLNDYYFGGLLIFEGIRPFIDGRSELYGDAFIQRYVDITRPDSSALDPALADYRIAWTFFRPSNPAVAQLDRDPGWRRLYADGSVVIHVRTDAPDGQSP
jgi:hypothetical protein